MPSPFRRPTPNSWLVAWLDPMLSILIPVYHYDVRTFVNDLQRQASALPIEWEILVWDDASPPPTPEQNQALADQAGVEFRILSENLGRANIRNAMAKAARYPYLLFLDGDGGLLSDQFLQTYVSALQEDTVLYGGRVYASEAPRDFSLRLHWYYGKEREVSTHRQRQQQPYHGFMTNNFCIPKAVYQSIGLNEELRQYGHEDTLFGLELERREIPIRHLDNPVIHLGLEKAEPWLHKQELAIQNLRWLAEQESELSTRALSTWRWLKRWRIMSLLYPLFRLYEPAWKQHLASHYPPNLRLLDLLKLFWLEKNEREE